MTIKRRAIAKPKLAKARPRTRRKPAEARTAILDAAEALFAERGPDAVGLKDVAEAASVTHGLVTHYFGTYRGLVHGVIERHRETTAARAAALLASTEFRPGSGQLLELLIDLLSDRAHVRLVAWAILSANEELPPFDGNRLRAMIDAASEARAKRTGVPVATVRREAEALAALVAAAAFGFTLAGDSFTRALGRKPSTDDALEFRTRLRAMVAAYVAAVTGDNAT